MTTKKKAPKVWHINPLADPKEKKRAKAATKWGRKLKKMSMEARGFE